MQKFNQKIAKEIAKKQFAVTLDCILGNQPPDYSLDTDITEFEQNFHEDLNELGIKPSILKIENINRHYLKMINKLVSYLKKLQN